MSLSFGSRPEDVSVEPVPPPGPPRDPRLEQALTGFRLLPGAPAQRLAGDVGARRYFRVAAPGRAAVLVLYPEPGSGAQASWTVLGNALAEAGVRVPECYEDAPDLGASLIEDLGDRDLGDDLAAATPAGRGELLDEAEALLFALRRIDPGTAARNPAFDAAFFAAELAATRRWALERGGADPLDPERAALWDSLATELAAEAADPAGGAFVPTHRDFHANNLMRTPAGALVVIDFQDLRLGPPDYDPVSLRYERAGAALSLAAGTDAPLREGVLLQRAWKVLGTFEKMLLLGREVYRPHRESTLRVLRRMTPPKSRFAPLLGLLSAG